MAAESETSEAEPTTRDARFIKTAVEILRETGRTDFTVQEVVARSRHRCARSTNTSAARTNC